VKTALTSETFRMSSEQLQYYDNPPPTFKTEPADPQEASGDRDVPNNRWPMPISMSNQQSHNPSSYERHPSHTEYQTSSENFERTQNQPESYDRGPAENNNHPESENSKETEDHGRDRIILPRVGQKRSAEESENVSTPPPKTTAQDFPSPSQAASQRKDDDSPPQDEGNKKRRGNLPKTATNLLKGWLFHHIFHPYPTEEEKGILSVQTGLSLNQISNWFINARRRILQPMIESARTKQIETGENPMPNMGKPSKQQQQKGFSKTETPSPPHTQEPSMNSMISMSSMNRPSSSSFPLHHAINGPYHGGHMHPYMDSQMSGHGMMVSPMSSMSGLPPNMGSHSHSHSHNGMPGMPGHSLPGHSLPMMPSSISMPPYYASNPGSYSLPPSPYNPRMMSVPGHEHLGHMGTVSTHGSLPLTELPSHMQQTLQKVGYNMSNSGNHNNGHNDHSQ